MSRCTTVRGADPAPTAAAVASKLGYPCFVKPACSGSSVGVSKVKTPDQLHAAIAEALRYDRKVLIEKAIAAREIEVAVLEHPDPAEAPLTSTVGEDQPASTHEFYSYTAKYLDERGGAVHSGAARCGAGHGSPAPRRPRLHYPRLRGLARVDFFLDRHDGQLYFNEVNTHPASPR